MKIGKERIEEYLRTNRVHYQLQHHPVAYTAQEVAETEHISGSRLAKVVMVVADDNLAMLVLPAPDAVDLNLAAAVLQAGDVRLAQEEEFAAAFPGCEIGAMPPFGNLYDLTTYVDQGLAEQDTIVFQAGTHADTISMRYADFARLARPVVAAFAR